MKSLKNCVVENCIPTPSSCIIWNGGEIEYLGICNGEEINNIIWEIVDKLKSLAGEDLSSFDITSLLEVCDHAAPLEVDLLSILTILKDNDICLKDYINTLNEKIDELAQEKDITVNLKCYADYDNLGNALQITRAELDQLVINELCDHKTRIETLEGKIVALQAEVDAIDPHAVVDEPSITTCVNGTPAPTSVQVQYVANAHCALETATGNNAHIASALSKVPGDWNSKFSTITGWDLTPDDWAQQYGNLLLVVANLESRILFMENNCCNVTCDDVEIGFSVTMNEDGDGIILSFTYGAGTSIPTGFTDQGSKGTITDMDGNVEYFNITIVNNLVEDIPITGLNMSGPLDIQITTKIGNGSTLCVGCVNKTFTPTSGCCIITNSSSEDVVIFYETPVNP